MNDISELTDLVYNFQDQLNEIWGELREIKEKLSTLDNNLEYVKGDVLDIMDEMEGENKS